MDRCVCVCVCFVEQVKVVEEVKDKVSYKGVMEFVPWSYFHVITFNVCVYSCILR